MPRKVVPKTKEETVEPVEVVEEKLVVDETKTDSVPETDLLMAVEEEPIIQTEPTPIITEEVQVTKGPAEFLITAPRVSYTREDTQVAGTIATLVPNLSLGEFIKIKRVN